MPLGAAHSCDRVCGVYCSRCVLASFKRDGGCRRAALCFLCDVDFDALASAANVLEQLLTPPPPPHTRAQGEAAAAINWVLKDGAGRVGRFLFARWGRELDCELKQFRLAGDILMEAGAPPVLLALPTQQVMLGAVRIALPAVC